MAIEFNKEALIDEICGYLSGKVADFCPHQHADMSFSRLGLDSIGHVELTSVVADCLQQDVDPTLAFDYPTINALAGKLEADFSTVVVEEA